MQARLAVITAHGSGMIGTKGITRDISVRESWLIGSTGMEIPDAPAKAFTVELVKLDGETEVFAEHHAQPGWPHEGAAGMRIATMTFD